MAAACQAWPEKYLVANLASKVIKCAHARLNKFNLHEFVKASRLPRRSSTREEKQEQVQEQEWRRTLHEDIPHKLPYKTDKNLCAPRSFAGVNSKINR